MQDTENVKRSNKAYGESRIREVSIDQGKPRMDIGRILQAIESPPRRVCYAIGAVVLTALLAVIDPHYFWCGIPFAAAGEAIQLWAAGYITKGQSLVASGPYARVRNPMYIGRFLVVTGFFVPLRNWLVLGLVVVVYVMYAVHRVGREEKRMRKKFGSEFAEYCASVRAWLPRPVPVPVGHPTAFSWQRLRQNHEHVVALGVAAYYLVLYLRLLLL